MISEPTLLLLIIGHGVRRPRGAPRHASGGRAFGGLNTAALVLVSIMLAAFVFAIWAMSTKPVELRALLFGHPPSAT